MVKPQQPELRRSEYGATSDDSVKGFLTAPHGPGEREIGGPVPEANLPGHHPQDEQDKPSGDAFVAKVQQLAAEAQASDGEGEAEVVDLPAEEARGETTSDLADRAAKVAGTPFKVAGTVLQRVRDRL